MSQRSPTCVKCKATSSLMWHKTTNGSLMCLDCQTAEKKTNSNSSSPQSTRSTTSSGQYDPTPSQNEKTDTSSQSPGPTTRRSTRSRERANKAKQHSIPQDSPIIGTSANTNILSVATTSNSVPSIPNDSKDSIMENKSEKPVKDNEPVAVQPVPVPATVFKDHHVSQWERSRRSLSLKLYQPVRSPVAQPEVVTSDSINHNGTQYEVGDIVSVLDEDGGVYYALLRGFLQDHHAERHVVITWLLPTHPHPTHFDPTRFILGPEEDIPMSLDVVEFVCHSPQSKNFQASYFHNIELASLWETAH